MSYQYLAALIVAAALPMVPAADKPGEKAGAADDGHGNLTWRSTVKGTEDLGAARQWEYGYYATNRSEAYRCRIRWEITGVEELKTTLPPAEKGQKVGERTVSTFTHEDPPKGVQSKFFYNGGRDDGEGMKQPEAWSYTRTKSKVSKGNADLGFEIEKAFYEVHVACGSVYKVAEKKVEYEMSFGLTAASDKELMRGLVGLRWTPLETTEVRPNLKPVKEYDIERNVFPLAAGVQENNDQKPRPITFSLPVRASDTHKLVEGHLQIIVLKEPDPKKQVAAQAPMPAIVSVPPKG